MKGSVLRTFFDDVSLRPVLATAPPPVADLARALPPVSAWVSEVEATALFLAATDAVFGSDDAFVQHAYERNMRLFDSAMYRIVFRLVGTHRIIRQVSQRWSFFHQGSELTVHSYSAPSRAASLLLTAPPRHVPPLFARAYGTAIRAALEVAGGRDVQCVVQERSPTLHEYAARWEGRG